jgi:hypothetical protein
MPNYCLMLRPISLNCDSSAITVPPTNDTVIITFPLCATVQAPLFQAFYLSLALVSI